MQTKFKTYEDERELNEIAKVIGTCIGVPLRCAYDMSCSHKYYDEELQYRRQEGILEANEYVIDYAPLANLDDISELIYTTGDGAYITLKYCPHVTFTRKKKKDIGDGFMTDGLI